MCGASLEEVPLTDGLANISWPWVAAVALIVALGGFLMGFDASVISGVVGFIEPEFSLSKIQLGWAVSCLTLTATLGMMISGPLSDALGRKKVLSLAAILYAVWPFSRRSPLPSGSWWSPG